jgi:hypothetical protein
LSRAHTRARDTQAKRKSYRGRPHRHTTTIIIIIIIITTIATERSSR